jgi:thiamine kinase-like enzyme
LFIEHLEDVQTVNRWRGAKGMRLATDWLGRFHLQSGSLVEEAPFLPRFDLAYYAFWAERAFNFTAALHDAHPWLPTVLTMPEEVFGPLLDACPVIIHGEFYPSNVLFDGETVYPVDWECAAIGPAELDVAFLIEGWPDDVAAQCLTTYKGAVDGRPAISKRRLAAAEAYLAVRYLGHKPGLASWQRGPERLEILRTIADQVGAVRT